MPKQSKFEEPLYTVGVNSEGYTVLKLHTDDGMTMSLKMSAAAVQQMIKLLAVTIEPLAVTIEPAEDDDGDPGTR